MSSHTLAKIGSLLPSEFDDFFKPWKEWTTDLFGSRSWALLTLPAVNISEDKDSYILSMASPGMKKEDFKIDLEGNVLTISTEMEEKNEKKEEKFCRKEYNYSSFSRSFNLPDTVNKSKIEATYEEGVLKLIMQKKEDAKTNGESLKISVN
ncbi:Hsp20 family protein [Chitinophaga sp. SYP-B3965]|uniref:Hsp20/alpha crystallin family protein n=1 Tax=Chitinophaga sp. SYP-B3965 TaxID=2663120 RepID=UPI001299C1C5|nr:Hsp20/alpha crystallin family protein [Chitinophaga sp. SYP-B3965]MRG45324.1 Hsp20 family protein [Chitinophaga sp. SYP-B3965]